MLEIVEGEAIGGSSALRLMRPYRAAVCAEGWPARAGLVG